MISVAPVATQAGLDALRGLWREYAAWLGPDLLPGMDAELAGLPGRYASPHGALLLARALAAPVGCVALRPLDVPDTCELKRLYVRPRGRGTGAGRALVAAAEAFARRAGHRRILLDTLPRMESARRLYTAMGFVPVPRYNADMETPGLIFLGKELR